MINRFTIIDVLNILKESQTSYRIIFRETEDFERTNVSLDFDIKFDEFNLYFRMYENLTPKVRILTSMDLEKSKEPTKAQVNNTFKDIVLPFTSIDEISLPDKDDFLARVIFNNNLSEYAEYTPTLKFNQNIINEQDISNKLLKIYLTNPLLRVCFYNRYVIADGKFLNEIIQEHGGKNPKNMQKMGNCVMLSDAEGIIIINNHVLIKNITIYLGLVSKKIKVENLLIPFYTIQTLGRGVYCHLKNSNYDIFSLSEEEMKSTLKSFYNLVIKNYKSDTIDKKSRDLIIKKEHESLLINEWYINGEKRKQSYQLVSHI